MARSSTPPPESRASALTASLAMVLIGVGAKLREHLDAQLNEHGITMRHLGALEHLAASPELSTSDLARRARVTPQSMRATVDQLDSIGAVEHRRHGQGKPSELRVTDAGQALLESSREVIAALDADLLGDIPHDDELRTALLATMFELHRRQQPDPLV